MRTSIVLLSALSLVVAAPLPHTPSPQSYGIVASPYSSVNHQSPPNKRATPAIYSTSQQAPCSPDHFCPTEKRDAHTATPQNYGLTENIYSTAKHQNPPSKRVVPEPMCAVLNQRP